MASFLGTVLQRRIETAAPDDQGLQPVQQTVGVNVAPDQPFKSPSVSVDYGSPANIQAAAGAGALENARGSYTYTDPSGFSLPQSSIYNTLQGLSPAAFTYGGELSPAAIQAAQIDQARFATPSQYAAQQASMIAALQARAAGQAGPSMAEQLLKSQQDQAIRQQLALAATMGGRAAPSALRQIQQQSALGQQEAIRQAALLRSQEQAQAEQALGGALESVRAQDLQRQQILANIAQANQTAQQQAAIESSRQQLQAQQIGREQDLQRQIAEEQAAQVRRQLQADIEASQRAARTQLETTRMSGQASRDVAQKEMQADIAGSVLQGLGGLVVKKSDRRAKTNINDVSKKDLDEFFKAIKPKSYKYKNQQWGEGNKIGFMMQDIVKTKLGKKIARTLPDGHLGYDKQGLEGILLAKLAFETKNKKGDK